MFNWLKNKKLDNETRQEESDSFIFSYSAIKKQSKIKTKNAWIESWEAQNGDYLEKEDVLCSIEINGRDNRGKDSCMSITVYADNSGFLEVLKKEGNNSESLILDNDKLFTLYPKLSDSLVEKLRLKRFVNTPNILIDEFNNSTEIKWKNLAGQKEHYSFSNEIKDCFLLVSKEDSNKKLIFTINNLNGKDYLVLRYLSREYKLAINDKISFLFSNGDVLNFDVSDKPYKHSNDYDYGSIYETRIQITNIELETLKNESFIKWKIGFTETGNKISGKIESNDHQFAFKKFTKEYLNLVASNVKDYKPLEERSIIESKPSKNNEACYLYLMIDLANNYYKIGISNKPEYREKTLQSEKPSIEMVCNKRFPNRIIASSFESALHKSYGEKRIRGEWFNLNEQEVKDIVETLSN